MSPVVADVSIAGTLKVPKARQAPLTRLAAQHEDWIIQQAITLLEKRIFKTGPILDSPNAVRDYLRLKLIAEPNEVFAALFMNSHHQLLAYEPLFKGTINSTTVHPRVVIQRGLALNAAALIVVHQHPSGHAAPSRSDELLTTALKTTLASVDIRLLDHWIVGQGTPYSFAESGLL